jgi:hypothetical protein
MLNLACRIAELVTSFECFVYFSVLWTHVGQLKGAELFPDQLVEFVVSTSGACSPKVFTRLYPLVDTWVKV